MAFYKIIVYKIIVFILFFLIKCKTQNIKHFLFDKLSDFFTKLQSAPDIPQTISFLPAKRKEAQNHVLIPESKKQ